MGGVLQTSLPISQHCEEILHDSHVAHKQTNVRRSWVTRLIKVTQKRSHRAETGPHIYDSLPLSLWLKIMNVTQRNICGSLAGFIIVDFMTEQAFVQ